MAKNLLKLLFFGILLPVIGSVVSIVWFPDVRIDHEPIHLLFEIAGTFIVFAILPFLFRLNSKQKIRPSYKNWVAAGLLGMGVLDGFHAFAHVGNNFVWLHSLATFVGGLFFVGVLIPSSFFKATTRLPNIVFVLSVIIGIFSFTNQELIPLMVVDGDFTLLARALNIVGGIFFLAAVVYFYRQFLKQKNKSFYYLAAHCLLFGVAGILFELSSLWDVTWWWWHILRLVAYVILIFYYLSKVEISHTKAKPNFDNRKKSFAKLVTLPAFTVLIVAVIVIFGWYTQNLHLVQILPQFAPMQMNTALCFLLASLGCVFLLYKPKVAKVFGVLLFLFSFFTLLQYLLGLDFGIDEFFIKATVLTKVSHPGRMAPNTALSFILVGLALVFDKNFKFFISLTGAVLLLAFLAFFGYLIGFEGLYGLGALTRMALHTSICFLLISISLFVFYQIQTAKKQFDFWQIAPAFIFVTITSATLFVWHSMQEIHEQQTQSEFAELVEDKITKLKERFVLYEQALLGGVGFITGSNNVSRKEWHAYANSLKIKEYLPGTNGIGFIDRIFDHQTQSYLEEVQKDYADDFKIHPQTNFKDKFVIKYIEPENINKPAIGLDIGFEKNRRNAAKLAIDTGKVTLTKKILLVQDEKQMAGFLLLAPVYHKNKNLSSVENRRKAFYGWVYSPFMARKFLQDIEDVTASQIAFAVYDGKKISAQNLIYTSSNYQPKSTIKKELFTQTSLKFAQQTWTITWQPTSFFKAKTQSTFSAAVLISGVLFALLLAGLFYFFSKLYGASARQTNENRKRLDSIFKSTVDGIITIDQKGIIDSFNPACEKLFGYTVAEVLGQNIKMLMPRGDSKKHDGYLQHYLKTGQKKIIGTGREAIALRKDGSPFEMELSVSETKIGEKKIFTGIVRDITERKQIEKMKNEFVSTVSHELRTPLTSVQTSIGLLQLNQDKLDGNGKRMLELAYANCERLADLLNDILDIEKIAAGKMEYVFEEIDVVPLVKKVIDQNQTYAQKYGVYFYIHSQFQSAFCRIDKNRFTQALINLFSNAAKFSPVGETVTISLKPKNKNQNEILISVSDKGPGIPESFYSKIFTKFAQADSSSTRKKGGTGLGLNITKSIIEAFGGTISFESKKGMGTTFYFILPLKKSNKIKEIRT